MEKINKKTGNNKLKQENRKYKSGKEQRKTMDESKTEKESMEKHKVFSLSDVQRLPFGLYIMRQIEQKIK